MNYSIGDGLVALSLAGAIVGCLQIVHLSRRRYMEIIHQERLAAMEKGIPLPELPLDPTGNPAHTDPTPVLPILGIVLLTLSVGTMIVLRLTLSTLKNGFWIAPLPFAFLGAGLVAFHFLRQDDRR